jgi:hypothetical protein
MLGKMDCKTVWTSFGIILGDEFDLDMGFVFDNEGKLIGEAFAGSAFVRVLILNVGPNNEKKCMSFIVCNLIFK